MTSYIPETVYGVIPGTYGQMGLIPWPKHMTPNPANLRASSGLELTKKAEAYVASALADPAWRGRPIPLTRKAIESEIDRLIELLDVADDDPDLEPDNDDEPYLGWPDRGPSQLAKDVPQDDREADNADLEATALERHGKGFVASGADDAESTHDDEPSLGGTCYGGGGLEYDLELDTADAEPSLAATEAFHQDDAWHVPEDKWNIEDGEQDAGDAPEFDHAEYDQQASFGEAVATIAAGRRLDLLRSAVRPVGRARALLPMDDRVAPRGGVLILCEFAKIMVWPASPPLYSAGRNPRPPSRRRTVSPAAERWPGFSF